MHPKVREFEQPLLKPDIPDFKPGDTVRISVRIQEGDKERVQDFEGVCIRRRGGGMRETFTLRRVSYGVGIERTFPLHSPFLESLKVVKRGKVRRAKLYYLRERRGKKARITEVRYEAPTEVTAAPADQETEVSEQQPAEAQPSDDKTQSNEQ